MRLQGLLQPLKENEKFISFLNKNNVRYNDILEAEKTNQIIKILTNLGCINV